MKDKLLKLLKGFDIPSYRKTNLNKNNLEWLDEHLVTRNSSVDGFEEASEIIKTLIENKDYVN